MGMITFTVHGEAKPAGSKRGFPIRRANGSIGVAMSDACAKTKPWQAEVKAAAREVYAGPPLDCPLRVRMTFQVARPAYHFGSKGLKDRYAYTHPTKRPDLLKLARAIEDAMTGIVYRDDSLIVHEILIKHFGESPLVEVSIEF